MQGHVKSTPELFFLKEGPTDVLHVVHFIALSTQVKQSESQSKQRALFPSS